MHVFRITATCFFLLSAFQTTAQGIDSDGDGTPDVTDHYPFNPFKNADDWGQNVETYPEVFVTSDVSELNEAGLIRDLKLAANYFGKYEMEWWGVGKDVDAMLELAGRWCDRRIERGQLFYFEEERNNLDRLKSICLTQVAHPHASLDWSTSDNYYFTSDINNYSGWMEYYRLISLETPMGATNAGTRRDMGYTASQSSWPWVFDPTTNLSEWMIPEKTNAVLVFHEYYHIVQAQNVFSNVFITDETGNTVRPEYGPTAFSEGSANYISEYLIRALSKKGIYQGTVFDESLKSLMRQQMESIQNMLPSCPDFQIEKLNYGNPCDPYTFGMWATAYLTNKVDNINAFHEVFWPKINELTYAGAFEDTFGLSYEKFNTVFQEFLSLPIEEQLATIPEVNFVNPDLIEREAATFSVDTLSIPSVLVDTQAYTIDLKLIQNTASGIVFQVGSAEVIDQPEVPSSIYYGKVGVLEIPEVKVESETYTVSLELENPTDLSFRLISAEAVE